MGLMNNIFQFDFIYLYAYVSMCVCIRRMFDPIIHANYGKLIAYNAIDLIEDESRLVILP